MKPNPEIDEHGVAWCSFEDCDNYDHYKCRICDHYITGPHDGPTVCVPVIRGMVKKIERLERKVDE